MKHVLLATTALAMTASFAAADVSLSAEPPQAQSAATHPVATVWMVV